MTGFVPYWLYFAIFPALEIDGGDMFLAILTAIGIWIGLNLNRLNAKTGVIEVDVVTLSKTMVANQMILKEHDKSIEELKTTSEDVKNRITIVERDVTNHLKDNDQFERRRG